MLLTKTVEGHNLAIAIFTLFPVKINKISQNILDKLIKTKPFTGNAEVGRRSSNGGVHCLYEH